LFFYCILRGRGAKVALMDAQDVRSSEELSQVWIKVMVIQVRVVAKSFRSKADTSIHQIPSFPPF
jgi:hypothetical protein